MLKLLYDFLYSERLIIGANSFKHSFYKTEFISSITRDLGITQRVNVGEVRLNDMNFYDYQETVINYILISFLFGSYPPTFSTGE